MPAAEPARFLLAHERALREAAALGPVLDLACGRGRNALAAARLGARVVAIDRSAAALAALRCAAAEQALPVAVVRADLEADPGLPLRAGAFGAVLVFRFLYRPLAGAIAALLRPGGLLLYETFTHHQRDLPQGPSNPAFLLGDGELPTLFPELAVLTFREGVTEGLALAGLAARRL